MLLAYGWVEDFFFLDGFTILRFAAVVLELSKCSNKPSWHRDLFSALKSHVSQATASLKSKSRSAQGDGVAIRVLVMAAEASRASCRHSEPLIPQSLSS